jgi:transcriptional/translational regulatory protein YebC/TACO1
VTCDSHALYELKASLEAAGMTVGSAVSTLVSSLQVPVTDIADAKAILRIMDDLEDNDDVQDVYANFDMSDAILEEAAS